MRTSSRAQELAEDWVAAWNAHDIEAIMAHYADAIEFTSPLVVERLRRPDGTIRDRAELRHYFLMGLEASSDLAFDLQNVLIGVDSCTLYYHNHRGRTVAEMVFLDDGNRIWKAVVTYV